MSITNVQKTEEPSLAGDGSSRHRLLEARYLKTLIAQTTVAMNPGMASTLRMISRNRFPPTITPITIGATHAVPTNQQRYPKTGQYQGTDEQNNDATKKTNCVNPTIIEPSIPIAGNNGISPLYRRMLQANIAFSMPNNPIIHIVVLNAVIGTFLRFSILVCLV